jgi:alpha-beta hydrolase superfamily lysophospholipase
MTDVRDQAATATGRPQPPDVPGVWRRWEPRFIAAGVDANIVQRLKAEIETWDAWLPAWTRAASELEEHAQTAFDRGRRLTAGELWALASIVHHFGGMYFIADLDQFHASHRRAVDAFRHAAPLLDPPAIRIVGELDGVELVGYLRVPPSPRPPPVVMLFNGFEGTKEESNQRVGELHARGLASLAWDGPGRGETWEHLPMTGHYGPAAGAMIDALEGRDDVDATRVGAMGPNRGGFVASKAAAHEPRIAALAVTSPGYDRRETDWKTAYEEAFFLHLFHASSAEELRESPQNQSLTLTGDAASIACPTLIVAGDRDHGPQFEGSKRLYDEVSGEKEWAVVKGSERNGNNVPYIIRPMMADFLAERLGAS